MTRPRGGNGRHRQPWITALCPCCDGVVQARRTRPGHPLHVRVHFLDDGTICPCRTLDKVVAA